MTKLLHRIKSTLGLYRHWGFGGVCPLCGFHNRKWRYCGHPSHVYALYGTVGAGYRRAGCWKCGCRERERMIFLYLRDTIHIFDTSCCMKILHIAPELVIADKLHRLPNLEYICGDLFTEGYSYPAYVQNMSVLDIPYPTDSFDLVICNHVFEHIQDDSKAMAELFRVLRPGGKAILQIPLSTNLVSTFEDPSITEKSDRETAFGQFDHVRLYGMDYFDRLSAVGFKPHQIDMASAYPHYGLNKNEKLIVCEK